MAERENGCFTPITFVQPCPPHRWAYAPTVGYYSCMKCSERRDWNHPQYADAKREYNAAVDRPSMTGFTPELVERVERQIACHHNTSLPPVEAGDIRALLSGIAELTARLQYLEAEARRFAAFYPEGSDGRNTFLIFADKIGGYQGASLNASEGIARNDG